MSVHIMQLLSQLNIWMSGCVMEKKNCSYSANTYSSFLQPLHLAHIYVALAPYLTGLSEGTSVKTSSGLGSGMGMMYSLYEVKTSCVPASCLRSPGLRFSI